MKLSRDFGLVKRLGLVETPTASPGIDYSMPRIPKTGVGLTLVAAGLLLLSPSTSRYDPSNLGVPDGIEQHDSGFYIRTEPTVTNPGMDFSGNSGSPRKRTTTVKDPSSGFTLDTAYNNVNPGMHYVANNNRYR